MYNIADTYDTRSINIGDPYAAPTFSARLSKHSTSVNKRRNEITSHWFQIIDIPLKLKNPSSQYLIAFEGLKKSKLTGLYYKIIHENSSKCKFNINQFLKLLEMHNDLLEGVFSLKLRHSGFKFSYKNNSLNFNPVTIQYTNTESVEDDDSIFVSNPKEQLHTPYLSDKNIYTIENKNYISYEFETNNQIIIGYINIFNEQNSSAIHILDKIKKNNKIIRKPILIAVGNIDKIKDEVLEVIT